MEQTFGHEGNLADQGWQPMPEPPKDDWLWQDEEPPVYTEGLTRTNLTRGPVWITFTPLLGMGAVVRRYLNEPSPDRAVIKMTLEDAAHYSAEDREKIIASYPEHERDARTNGIPVLGSGLVFPVKEESIKCEPFPIPEHWPRLGAMDFGWEHPFAAVKLAWDRDADTGYITHAHRLSRAPRQSFTRQRCGPGARRCPGRGRVTVGVRRWRGRALPWRSSMRTKV